MTTALTRLMPEAAIDIKGRKVIIEMICVDTYSARVLYEDLLEKVTSDEGLSLKLRGKLQNARGGKA